jgi:hypothetical protein
MNVAMKQAVAQRVIILKRARSGQNWLWNCYEGWFDGIIGANNPVESEEIARKLAYNPESFG